MSEGQKVEGPFFEKKIDGVTVMIGPGLVGNTNVRAFDPVLIANHAYAQGSGDLRVAVEEERGRFTCLRPEHQEYKGQTCVLCDLEVASDYAAKLKEADEKMREVHKILYWMANNGIACEGHEFWGELNRALKLIEVKP